MSTHNDQELVYPTARHPWTATLCWAGGKSTGAVTVFPNRTPVTAITDRLAAGETFSEVAADFDVAVEQVRLLWALRRDFLGEQ